MRRDRAHASSRSWPFALTARRPNAACCRKLFSLVCWTFRRALVRFGVSGQTPASSGDELRDAHEIVGDEIEQEIGTHDGNTAVLGLAVVGADLDRKSTR